MVKYSLCDLRRFAFDLNALFVNIYFSESELQRELDVKDERNRQLKDQLRTLTAQTQENIAVTGKPFNCIKDSLH